jgi:hypothetical protein
MEGHKTSFDLEVQSPKTEVPYILNLVKKGRVDNSSGAIHKLCR